MPVNKIDSNAVGTRYAREDSLKVLPANPFWRQVETNSFGDTGADVSTSRRNPINDSRQNKKSTVTGVTAMASVNQDLTESNTTDLVQGFLFATAREKRTTAPIAVGGIARAITSVSAAKEYNAAAGLDGWKVGSLVIARNFGAAANNGLKTVTASVAAKLTFNEVSVAEASPPLNATLEVCGFQFPAADVQIVLNGGKPRLQSAATDLTTLGLIPGEWVQLGGDAAANRFANNEGFARCAIITSTYIEFDKTDWTGQAEGGAGKTIHMFFGTVIRNEPTRALIKRTSYTFERTLGEDEVGTMSEYIKGAVANELSIASPTEDIVKLDLSFMALDAEARSGSQGLLGGVRVDLPETDAFNTSLHYSRIKLGAVDESTSNVVPLAAYLDDLNITVNNNASVNKALGVFGGFDISTGNFDVSGSVRAYFNSVAAIQAVRKGTPLTLDFAMAKPTIDGTIVGILVDLPLITPGGGRPNVEPNESIKLELNMDASRGKFGSTMTWQQFPYLPNIVAQV